MDSIFGDAGAAGTPRGAPEGLEAERGVVSRFLAREQAAQAEALASVLDPKAAERMSARILDRVRRDEDRRVEFSGRRRFWARFLAISVAAHVVALGVFSYRHFRAPEADPAARPDANGRDVVWAPEASDPSPSMDGALASNPLEQALPGYDLDRDERLPVDRFLERPLLDPSSAADPALTARPLGMARAMWVRTSDPTKRRYDALVGVPGPLDRVKSSLAALARLQADDGSFPDASGRPATRATATVLLAFLGDGNSSRGGVHRAVVERGVAWLAERAHDETAPAGDRAFALLALSEDVLLSNGELTPAEARVRIRELAPLAEAVRASASSTGHGAAGEGVDGRWTELALAAATRVGAVRGTMVALATINPATIGPADDVRTAMLDGTTLLKDRHGQAFRAWNAGTARTLGARLGADGLAAGAAPASARAEETALVLLALQVAYRTY